MKKQNFLIAMLVMFAPLSLADSPESLKNFTPELDAEFIALLNNADLEKGEYIFTRKCSSCHDHEQDGGHSKGPHLWNVFSRQAGTIVGFDFSEAMKGSGHVWNFATINYFLTRTDRAVPGRKMKFRGMRQAEKRANLIAYLATLNDNPPLLPK